LGTCDNCGRSLGEGERLVEVVRENEASIHVCETCAQDVSKLLKKNKPEPKIDIYLGKSILFGSVGGILSALFWYSVVFYSHLQVGFVAVGVGWLTAQGVILGAGKHRDNTLAVLSASITLCALIFAQYLLVRNAMIVSWASEGYTGIVPLLLPLDVASHLVIDSLLYNPLSLIFWIIAIGEAYMLPLKWRP